jgi:OmpA-OmpF porin, OOP family
MFNNFLAHHNHSRMHKVSIYCFVFLLGILSTYAQKVQWASEIHSFSSELTPVQYSAKQVLGKPNAFPPGGENPNAWTPAKANRKEFIRVNYAEPMAIQQIAIVESYNPSALFRIYVYDEEGNEYDVNTLNPRAIPVRGRVINLMMERTPYKVASVKLEFDGASVPEFYSIDAIAIADVEIPVFVEVNLPELLNQEMMVERLSNNVNSEYEEYNPILSPDGKTLYFGRKNHPENVGGVKDKEDIWYSELNENGEWSLAKNMGRPLNNENPNFINSVTADGKSVILLLGNHYLDNGKMKGGVSISTNEGGEWSKPTPLEIENDYNYSEKANYFMVNNRKVLLMSVERDDSYGDRDLYVSFLKDDQSWTEPLNLGSTLNTAAEESAPFLAADNTTLYFSSRGFTGYGGADIYMSKRLDDSWTRWTEPENLGPTINTPFDDLFFNIPASSEFAYYSRGMSETNSDIYRVALPIIQKPAPVVAVRGKTLNSKNNLPLEAKIIYERLPDGMELGITKSNPGSGEFEILLPAGYQYGIRAEMEGYIPENESLDLRNFEGENYTLELRNLKLAPIEEEVVVVLNNVFFEFDKAVLRPESSPELDRIASLLNEKKSLQIEIAGHTCHMGPEAYNLQLSERRARAVYDYLLGKGVEKDRLAYVFFGQSKPIATNDTLEGRKQNRRVEFKIVKK